MGETRQHPFKELPRRGGLACIVPAPTGPPSSPIGAALAMNSIEARIFSEERSWKWSMFVRGLLGVMQASLRVLGALVGLSSDFDDPEGEHSFFCLQGHLKHKKS